ncbi:hypothetical protein [uncultured Paludibaculum sp.]|uniref:hypothetical protein n=1 Tax=uncultured Paludibaculum sp. TaxID=1765020 RepID=UPI002AAABB21|nr:hypothetical protein [uncultured Paludibaculum sp.]
MVYVVQEVQGRNIIAGQQYGSMTVLLPPGDVVLSSGPTMRKLQAVLRHFNDDDYLLLMGDPVAIGMACAAASEANQGRFKVLKWDRQNHVYYPVAVDLNRKAITS